MDEYRSRLDMLTSISRRQAGAMFEQFRKMLKLEERAMDELIDEVLLDKVYESFRFFVGREQIVQELQELDFFKQSGFNRDTLRSYLRAVEMSETQFEKAMKNKVLGDQFGSALKVVATPSSTELKSAQILENTKRAYDYLEIKSSDFSSSVKTDDKEGLQIYFDNNIETYRKPRSVTFSFVPLPATEFEDKVEVAMDDLESAYESNKTSYKEPKAYLLKKILIKKEEQSPADKFLTQAQKDEVKTTAESQLTKQMVAEQVKARLDKGDAFDTVAKEVSEDQATKESGGNMGWISAPNLPPYMKTAIEKLDVGSYTPVLTSPEGYEIVLLDDLEQAKIKEMKDVMDDLRKIVKRENAPLYAQEYALKFLEEWENSKQSLSDFAKSKEKSAITTEKPLSANDPLPGAEPGLTKKVLELGDGEKTVIQLSSNSYIVEVIKVEESHVPKLEEVLSRVEEDYRASEAKNMAEERAKSLLSKLTAPSPESPDKKPSLKSIAEAEGLTVKNTELKTDKELFSGPFSQPENKKKVATLTLGNSILNETLNQGNSYFLVQLTAEDIPAIENWEEKLLEKRKTEKDKAGNRLRQAIMAKLRTTYNTKVDPKVYEQVRE